MRITLAAVVHVGQTHRAGARLRRKFLDGRWPLRQTRPAQIRAYLDPLELLLPVTTVRSGGRRRLVVVEARWIVGYHLTRDGKVVFDTVPAPEFAHLVGGPSPVTWARGEAWPVKVVAIAAAAPAATAA